MQIADVLAYLQNKGILHRDVKPENILLNVKCEATLIDLGFAKHLDDFDEEDGSENLTTAGMALGSPAYMAPEQVLDAQSATHATDCYCLGVSFYHMLTGQLPYEGKSAIETIQQVLSGGYAEAIALRPQIPPRLNQLINWMMAAKASDRPHQIQDVHAILKRLIVDPEDGTDLPALKKPMNTKVIAVVVIVGLVLLAAVLAFALK